ncbi:MAG: IS1634 family transposase [Chloroflexi bacterium]|nr:MAG: IS1634 family transposase [Chloroflexota bacterium]
MHVVTNRVRRGDREYTSTLLRRSYREGGRVKKQTLANLSHLDAGLIELIRGWLRGERYVERHAAFQTERSLPAGHVNAVLAMARKLDLARLLDREPSRERDLALAMICQRALHPQSKLATARALTRCTLASELSVEGADQDDLYAAMDWLAERQARIEDRLARRHLQDSELVLYDVSSSYFEGHTCPLAQLGYSRDGKRGTLQIIYGLLCDRAGRPIAVEVFEGSLHDDKTLPSQVEKLTARFRLSEIVVVADRGMITKANIEALRATEGVGWITALKAPQVKKLVKDGDLQLSLFDEQNLAEITSEDYPGERLIVCRNPLVGSERTRKREDLLAATERELSAIAERVKAGTLSATAQIALAVGPALKGHRVKKHFQIEIADERFSYSRKAEQIASEAALDGFYVLRTSVPAKALSSAEVVRSYKQLKQAERNFKTIKGPEVEIRPIGHRLEQRVRAHVFLCMLACYLTWHLKQAWAELLFKDEHPPVQADPVTKASRSAEAERKARTKRTARREPVHSFRSLIAELSTQTRNTVRVHGSQASFHQLTTPTELQARAHQLIEQQPRLK